MSRQKVMFLYCSPSGETVLNTMMREYTQTLTAEKSAQALEPFMRAIHKSRKGHSIRVWFNVDYGDTSPGTAFFKRFLAKVSEDDIYFARFGQQPDDVEEIGRYESIQLPDID